MSLSDIINKESDDIPPWTNLTVKSINTSDGIHAQFLRTIELPIGIPTNNQALSYDSITQKLVYEHAKQADAASIQGVPVSATTPVLDQVLAFDGSEWVPSSGGGGATSLILEGEVEFWISPSGDDENDGGPMTPVLTMERIIELLVEAGPYKTGIINFLYDGGTEYEPLTSADFSEVQLEEIIFRGEKFASTIDLGVDINSNSKIEPVCLADSGPNVTRAIKLTYAGPTLLPAVGDITLVTLTLSDIEYEMIAYINNASTLEYGVCSYNTWQLIPDGTGTVVHNLLPEINWSFDSGTDFAYNNLLRSIKFEYLSLGGLFFMSSQQTNDIVVTFNCSIAESDGIDQTTMGKNVNITTSYVKCDKTGQVDTGADVTFKQHFSFDGCVAYTNGEGFGNVDLRSVSSIIQNLRAKGCNISLDTTYLIECNLDGCTLETQVCFYGYMICNNCTMNIETYYPIANPVSQCYTGALTNNLQFGWILRNCVMNTPNFMYFSSAVPSVNPGFAYFDPTISSFLYLVNTVINMSSSSGGNSFYDADNICTANLVVMLNSTINSNDMWWYFYNDVAPYGFENYAVYMENSKLYMQSCGGQFNTTGTVFYPFKCNDLKTGTVDTTNNSGDQLKVGAAYSGAYINQYDYNDGLQYWYNNPDWLNNTVMD